MPAIIDSGIIRDRIARVRKIMADENVDVYIVETGDYHISEYAGEYFSEREFITGFTGSAGTAVITRDTAALFTDGRYFVQAELQLEGTGVELMRIGTDGVPTLMDYCEERLRCILQEMHGKTRACLGFDGRTVDALMGIELKSMVDDIGACMETDFNAIEKIYMDRPAFPHSKAYMLDERYSGESVSSKLARVRQSVDEMKADVHFIATLDDICWLFNIRGNDVECNPVIMAYACICKDKAYIYADADRFDENIMKIFQDNDVHVRPYDQVYDDASKLGIVGDITGSDNIYISTTKHDQVYDDASKLGIVGDITGSDNIYKSITKDGHINVLIDERRINTLLYDVLDRNPYVQIVDEMNPEVKLKSVKNATEIENLRSVHVDDGLALTRFIMWVKEAVGSANNPPTEFMAAAYLDNLRSKISDYVELSFSTISAYNENAAMMHYAATKDNCAKLRPEGLLLVDSGGQYLRGTTDVTRTIALGPVPDEWKRYYTLTLKGMLALADAHFLKGCTGINLDILARQPLWDIGIDYRCGTGHGVGYMLNVHEAPNGFRWKITRGKSELTTIEEGMVTSDEPGVYIDGKMGIRIENELVCVKDYDNEYGTFLCFEMLTCAPLEMDLVDEKLLDKKDIERINNYNKFVYDTLSPHMTQEEQTWLRQATRLVG